MMTRVLAATAGVLGGTCWVARWLVGETAGWAEGAQLGGFVLLGLALAGAGAALVSSGAIMLRLLVAVALPLLVWSVYAVVKGDDDGVLLDGVVGAVAVLGSLAGLVVARRRGRQVRHHGSHSSR